MVKLPVPLAIAFAIAAACTPNDNGNGANNDDDEPPPPLAADGDASPVRAAAEDPAILRDPPDPPETGNPLMRIRPQERSRVLEITLRSSPPGATAAVDGRVVGETPTFWRGKMSPNPREFTFVLADHAMARYRFVATTSGVVHATLLPLTNDAPDAGP
jgi:hypothetical protein